MIGQHFQVENIDFFFSPPVKLVAGLNKNKF